MTLAIDPPNTFLHNALIDDMSSHAPSLFRQYVWSLVAPPGDGTSVPSKNVSPFHPSGSQSQVPLLTTDTVVIVNVASTSDAQCEASHTLAKKKRRVTADIWSLGLFIFVPDSNSD